MTFLLDRERDLVCHAVGCWDGYGRRALAGHRNHFAASPGSEDDRVWSSLVGRGLATVSPPTSWLPYNLYRATAEAARLAGLSEAAIVRACGTPEQQRREREKRDRDAELRRARALKRQRVALAALRAATDNAEDGAQAQAT